MRSTYQIIRYFIYFPCNFTFKVQYTECIIERLNLAVLLIVLFLIFCYLLFIYLFIYLILFVKVSGLLTGEGVPVIYVFKNEACY